MTHDTPPKRIWEDRMTDLTREQLEALLDGATQGPWQADGEPWNRIVWSSAENRVCFMAHSNGLDDARDIATSNLVAAAPDLARQLLATMIERDEAQAAQALVVERACLAVSEQADWPEDEHGRTEQPELFARVINAIRSLAPASGLEALAALRAERDRMNQWRETAIVERDIYSEERDDALARLAEAQKREADYQEALIWCSGSDDFQADGKARTGWLKLCAPLIDYAAISAAPTTVEPSSTSETHAQAEDRICSCGAGHGSLEGHLDWCDWVSYLALSTAPIKEESYDWRSRGTKTEDGYNG